MPYAEQTFNLPELKGLSTKQIDVHLKLYAGYVKNVNLMLEKLNEPEIKRRFGFEFNGMRLHELYFEALGGNGEATGSVVDALATQYGSFDAFLAEWKALAAMRGIGWVLLTFDQKAKAFHTVWVSDHELGHLGGLPIILAMDMWEHAFMVDYVPAQKADYVAAFMSNLNWSTIDSRFAE